MSLELLEKLIYEFKPICYLGSGFIALQSSYMHRLGRIPATALIICGLIVIFWRLSHRGYVGDKPRLK